MHVTMKIIIIIFFMYTNSFVNMMDWDNWDVVDD